MERPSLPMVLVILGAVMGLTFSAFSTSDFVAHLDRQVHSLHCSFVPGIARTDASGQSGCHVTMMSPYSSFLRDQFWGGLPISLPAMSVFAFLLFWGLKLVIASEQRDRARTGFLFLATLVPVLASIVMGVISFATLGTACKLCIGIYAASVISALGAWWLWRQALANRAHPHMQRYADDPPFPGEAVSRSGLSHGGTFSLGRAVGTFVLGVLFVAIPLVAYVQAMPDYRRYTAGCGDLEKSKDAYGVMVPIGPQSGTEAIEVLDPLCPACVAFERRLESSGLHERISRHALLFPLDSACNWMVSEAVHPGACAVSEAILCAGRRADRVLQWAFEHQAEIRAQAAKRPESAKRAVLASFPELRSCLGSPKVKSQINRSLRWVVSNHLPVLTPQLYIAGKKLCDEDIDLGLNYTLDRMLAQQGGH
ncbi:MAG: hypothetical protein H6714_09750 [Myxococcales bacterium]|nr:hypothetical protein [Myxococcales bacterium]